MTITAIISGLTRMVVAIILLQTLFYKFTAHPDSVWIFSQLGIEPWGRIGLGIAELLVSALILIPKTKYLGMPGALFIMIGAIGSHLLVLGVNVTNDHGKLFSLALIVSLCCTVFILLHRQTYARYRFLIKAS
jgi:putative oxidoreductase